MLSFLKKLLQVSGWLVASRPPVILQGRLLFGAILVAVSPVISFLPFVILRGPPSIAAWRVAQGGLLSRTLSDYCNLVHPRVFLERRRLLLPDSIDDAVDPGHCRPLGYSPPQLSNVLTCGITDCQ